MQINPWEYVSTQIIWIYAMYILQTTFSLAEFVVLIHQKGSDVVVL